MAVMRSPRNTPLFMHENVPAVISAPTRIRIGHPEKDLLHISNSRGILRSKCSVPSVPQIGDHESRYQQRSHFLLLLRKLSHKEICCITLLPLSNEWQQDSATSVYRLCSRLESSVKMLGAGQPEEAMERAFSKSTVPRGRLAKTVESYNRKF